MYIADLGSYGQRERGIHDEGAVRHEADFGTVAAVGRITSGLLTAVHALYRSYRIDQERTRAQMGRYDSHMAVHGGVGCRIYRKTHRHTYQLGKHMVTGV